MYFDLNERSRANGTLQSPGGTVSDDPLSPAPPPAPAPAPATSGMSPIEQAAMYLFIVLGVLFAPFLNLISNGTALPKELVNPVIVVGAAIIGFFIIPTVWEKVGARPDAPAIVRFALFFQNGVFWQTILGTIFAAASGSATPPASG
jgi:hypothetical protein